MLSSLKISHDSFSKINFNTTLYFNSTNSTAYSYFPVLCLVPFKQLCYYSNSKKKKKRKEKRYLKGKKFCWKKFLRKIFSRLSSKTFHLIFYYFYPLLAPSSSCAPPPSYMIRRNFHPNLLIRIFRVNLRIQSEYEKYEPKKTPNSNSFHAVMNQRVITCFN